MELKQITESSAEFARVAEIYDEAFPPQEKVPLPMLFTKDIDAECEVFALKEENDTVGLISVALTANDILYLWYFAIDGNIRGKGYGAKALRCLRKQFPDRYIFFVVETPDENAPNNEQRLKRISFYEREDFVLTGESVPMRGANYLVMSQKGAPSRPIVQILLSAAAAAEKK